MRNVVDYTPEWRSLSLSYFGPQVLDSLAARAGLARSLDGADPGWSDRAAEGDGVGRAPGRGPRRGAQKTRRRSDRTLPVPRRQDAVARDHAGEEPVALPGCVSGRRHGDRLGDASGRRVVPARGGARAGDRVLPPNAAAKSRRARLRGEARAVAGSDPPLQARLREPHARLPAAR